MFARQTPQRPEGAEAPSPGQSPWVNKQSAMRPVRAKALKITLTINILTLQIFTIQKMLTFAILIRKYKYP